MTDEQKLSDAQKIVELRYAVMHAIAFIEADKTPSALKAATTLREIMELVK